MKRKSIVDTLPVAIGILVSWCMYVLLMETFNVNQVVEGSPSRLAFLMLLTYLLTLTLIYNFQMFRVAAYVFLGYVVERIATYFLAMVKRIVPVMEHEECE